MFYICFWMLSKSYSVIVWSTHEVLGFALFSN